MQIQLSRCLDTRYKPENGKYPVCIRLYKCRKYDYVQTGVYLTPNEYEKLQLTKYSVVFKNEFQTIGDIEALITQYLNYQVYNIKAIRAHVNEKILTLRAVTLPEFTILSEDVIYWFIHKIKQLKKNQQFGSAESYTSTMNVLQNFLIKHLFHLISLLLKR